MKKLSIILSVFLFVLSAGNSFSQGSSGDEVKKAVCVLNPTQGNEVTGKVTFTKVADGVRVVAEVEGLTPGKHGFHIHEFGDCSSPDGNSAGSHFNPTKKSHGSPDAMDRHAGDMGNIEANASGKGRIEYVDKAISMEGDQSIIGKSMIIHANEDDLRTQPTGNAGARLACGVIEAER